MRSRFVGVLTLLIIVTVTLAVPAKSARGSSSKAKKAIAGSSPARHFRKGTSRKSTPTPQPVQEPKEKERDDKERYGEIEDVKGRQDWFMFQRKYPFDSIPDDARRLAWETRVETLNPEAAWQSLGPAPTTSAFPSNWGITSGRIDTIAVSPANTQLVLIGGATGGIWRSTDGGTTFAPTSDSQTDLAVQSIAFSPSSPTIVYAGMGDTDGGYLGTGVLKSTDSGQTWVRINNSSLPSPGLTAKLEVDPANPNRVYLGQYAVLGASGGFFSSGFYTSTDGGVSWGSPTLVGLPRDLVINPAASQTLYLAMSRVDDGVSLPGLYRSTNGGTSWVRIYTTPYDANATFDVSVAVTPANSQVIYVYTGGLINSVFETRVEISTNGGTTWTNRGSATLDRAQFGYNTYIYVDPTNANTVYAGTRDVFKSTNAGVSWTNLTNNFDTSGAYHPNLSNTHPDQHSFTFLPGTPNTIFIGNDGGVSKTTNGGTSFASLNSSLSLTMFVGYALHPTNSAISYGGTQDNGSQKRLAAPGQWREFISGDGGNCVINPSNTSMVFTTYVNGTIFRFINDGDTFDATVGQNTTFGESNSNPRIAFYAPFVGNGVDSTLYFGTWRLFKSTNLGNTWAAPAGMFDQTKGITANGADVLSAIGVSRSNNNVIYSGSAQGRAMVSTNGGTSWTDITTGLPNRFITAITVNPTNPANAYLTVSGFRSGHVWKTTNTGATWTDVSGTLPDIPTNALLIDPLNANTVYAATDIGMFRSTTGGTNWLSFNSGLPPVVVNAVSAQSGGLIQIGTYGRGAYQISGTSQGSQTIGVYLPSNRTFYLRNSNSPGFADLAIQYGPAGATALAGDWNGDGTTTIGVFDPATQTFYLRNSNSPGFADLTIRYGPPGAIPVVGDWNGDGTTTIGVYDPVTRTFYLRNSNTPGNADLTIQYGPAGGVPVVGDWDGNGTTTIGVYDPSSRTFYLRNANTIGFADLTIQYGPSGATPIVGDFDGNGTVTIGVYDPTNQTFYLRNSNSIGFADITVRYGPAGATPLAGNWDGL